MSCIIRRVLLCVAVIALLAVKASAQQLPNDPALVIGKLDNGMEYIVRQHAVPPGRAVIWVHIHSGSLNETDRQRGIAHYLEHMAFNGSKNFAPGTLVPMFQSLGMTFGRDQNAFTNMQETTYQLTLPDTKPETLGKGMLFFSDVVGELLLLQTEVDAERQIILEERRRGLGARQRTSDYIQERMTPGSIYGFRDTIGTEKTLLEMVPQDFKDYYGKWYGPGNATLMVVADTDPATVIEVIKDKFGNLPAKPRTTWQALNIKPYEKSFAIVATDAELRTESIRIVRIEPVRPPTVTVEQWRDDLVASIGTQAMNRRLGEKVARGGTNYLSARVGLGNDSNALYTAEISATPKPEQWKAALNEMALELNRGKEFGFTTREIDDVKKEMISGAERAVTAESTAQASSLISRMNGAVGQREPIMSPTQRLLLLNKVLPTITAEEIAKRFAKEFDTTNVCFIAVLPASASNPTEAELLDLGNKALAVKPTKDAEVAHATKLMDQVPTPGSVKEGSEHAATKVWSGWLSNNARVHYKFNDTRTDEVSISISLIGGELLETAENRGITSAAQLAWSRAATKHLTSTDIRELMVGKKVNVGGGFGGGGGRGGRGGRGGGGGGMDGISLSISGSPEDLETGFQLAYLLLTEPKIEDPTFANYQTMTRQALDEMLKNPNAYGGRMVALATYPDNEPRTKPVEAEQVEKLNIRAAQEWLEKLIAESPIEITIVGDIEREKVMDLVARYLGALPKRDRISAETYTKLRQLQRPAGPREINKTIDTPTDQAFVFCGFYGTDESNIADARLLSMASRILSTRMVTEVREKEQLVYSIGSSSRAASTYPGFGVFSASAPTDPDKVPALVAKIQSMFETFAKEGPTEDELIVAKKQFAKTYEDDVRQPQYWSGRLSQITFRGRSLDDIVTEPDSYQQMTTQQIKDAFAKYWAKDKSIVVTVKPKGEGNGKTTGSSTN